MSAPCYSEKRILIVGYDPSYPLPGGQVTNSLLQSQTFRSINACLLSEGFCQSETEKYPNRFYYYVEPEAYSLGQFCRHEPRPSIGARLMFALKKAVWKLSGRKGRASLNGRIIAKRVMQIRNETSISRVLFINDPWGAKLNAAIRLKKKDKSLSLLVMFTELPTPFFPTKRKTVDYQLLKRMARLKIGLAHRSLDNAHFNEIRNGRTNIEIEFPLLRHMHLPLKERSNLLIYIGAFYAKDRNPAPLWNLMRKLKEYQLDVYGADRSFDPGLPNVVFKPACPMSSLLDIIAGCSAFVVVHNSRVYGNRKWDSKDITFFGYGKPILYFGEPHPDYGSYRAVLNAEQSTLQEIRDFLLCPPKTGISQDFNTFDKYTGDYVAKQILSFFKESPVS